MIVIELVKRTIGSFFEDDCFRMAAALSYYSVFSFAPILILAMYLCGFFWAPADVRGQVQEELTTALGEEGAEQVKVMLEHARRPSGGLQATLFSLGALLFGATGFMAELQNALNDAWGVAPDRNRGVVLSFLLKRLLSALMILIVALLLFGFMVASALLARASNFLTDWMPVGISVMMLQVANFLVSFVVTTILMILIFRILPDAEIGWGDVAIGAFVTAVLFTLGKWGMATYLASSDAGNAFGAAGALAVLLIWVYYSTCILLLGAEFTQAWTTRDGREVKPERGAVKVRKNETTS